MKNILIGIPLLLLSMNVLSEGVLENPKKNSVQSGIGMIYGWYCDANKIEIVFDDRLPKEAAYGTTRRDTVGVCGDDDNGFGLQWGWSILGKGWHTVRAYADGKLFAENDFYVGQIGDGSYLRGAEGTFELNGFPDKETEVVVEWNESTQNFSILESRNNTPNVDSASVGSNWSGVWKSVSFRVEGYLAFNDGTLRGKRWLFITAVDTDEGDVDVLEGAISGNKARVRNKYGSVDAVFDITLVSPNRAKMHTVSCVPASECVYQTGTTFFMDRWL